MEALTFDLELSEIVPFDHYSFKSDSVYLWVWHADKIPPHIGISSQGNYFSLKTNGKDKNIAIEKVRNVVQQKNIKTLLFELNEKLDLSQMEDCFDLYSKTVSNETTCLHPICALLNYPDAKILKDLLLELKANNRILKTIGFNIDNTFKGIQNYSVEDIHSRLRKLENV